MHIKPLLMSLPMLNWAWMWRAMLATELFLLWLVKVEKQKWRCSIPLWQASLWGLPLRFSGKKYTYDAGDMGLIPGLGRSPGEGGGTLLQYSLLENPMDRGAMGSSVLWWATVHGVTRSQTRLNWLGMHATVRLKSLILSLLPFGMLKTCVLKTVLSIISHELSNLRLWQSSHMTVEVWPRGQQKNSRWQKVVESLHGKRINL